MTNSSVHALGDLAINAHSAELINAVVIAAAAGVGGGIGSVGVGVSGAGVYAENKIKVDVSATIDGDRADGITAGSASLAADDASVINSIAGAVSIAAGLGQSAGVAVSIGLSLAFNEISNNVQASVTNAVLTTSSGDVSITAISKGGRLFDLALGAMSAEDFAEMLDDVATADTDNPNDPTEIDNNIDDPDDPLDDKVNEARLDIIEDQAILALLRAAFPASENLADADTVATDAPLTTDSGLIDLVRVVGDNQIEFEVAHGFGTGDAVVYDNGGETSLPGLNNGETYYVIRVDATHIKLAGSPTDAESETAIPIPPTPVPPPGPAPDPQPDPLVPNVSHTLRQLWNIELGTTVKLPEGYAGSGGDPDKELVYMYVGNDVTDRLGVGREGVDLSAEDYTSEEGWLLVDKLRVSIIVEGQSWAVVAPDGRTYVLELDEATGDIGVSRSTINSVSIAASVAIGVGIGGVGIAVAGAGAVSQNVVLTKVNAFATNSEIDSAGNVKIDAKSTSTISSVVVSVAAAVGVGQGVGVGVSIGIAVARNFIGWTPDGLQDAAEVYATLNDTSVLAAGELSLTSLASQQIDSIVIAGSIAVGVGLTVGIGAAGSGVFSENKVGADVKSSINGAGAEGIVADSVTLTAEDTSLINSVAGAISVAVAFGTTVGVGFSIGISISLNTITSVVEASIIDAGVLGVTAREAGGIDVRSLESATINAVTFAASVAVGLGTVGIAVAGSGAASSNVILTSTNAFVENSELNTELNSDGGVSVVADMDSQISALVLGISVAVGVGIGAGIGVAIGVAIARNFIGWDPGAIGWSEGVSGPDGKYLSSEMPEFLNPGDTVRVTEGVRQGDVYEYLGLNEDGIAESRDRWTYTSDDTDKTLLNSETLLENDLALERVKVEGTFISTKFNFETEVDETTDELTFSTAHGFSDGDLVTYHSTDGDQAGLEEGTAYRVVVDSAQFEFDTLVDDSTDELTFTTAHGFSDGDLVTYHSTDGNQAGLKEGTTYTVVVIDAFTIQLETDTFGSVELVQLDSNVDWTTGDSRLVKDFTIQLEDVSGGAATAVLVQLDSDVDWTTGDSRLVTTTPGIYTYVGAGLTGASLADSVQHYATNQDWILVEASNLSTQDYGDVSLWKQVVAPNKTGRRSRRTSPIPASTQTAH